MTPAVSKSVLVVDDDDEILRAHERILVRAGLKVVTAHDGREALELLSKHSFLAILSDIAMPELDGISLLREVRAIDLDLPVILATGAPDVASATAAVQHGAFRYLMKPIPADVLTSTVERAIRLHEYARARRAEALTDESSVGDYAATDARLTKTLEGLWMAFQPIVRYRAREVRAYEALMRTTDSVMRSPLAVLDAADRLVRHEDVGRRVRSLVASTLATAPDITCFVNLHVRDLLDESLYEANAPLLPYAKRVVLELTERAALETIKGLPECVARLRSLGYRIAVDDLGAGYSGLTSLAQLEPDIVKIDMSLVRDVDREPKKQKLIAAIASLCRDLGTELVVEGIETPAERDTLLELGCEIFQGYLFARPGKPFVDVAW